MNIPWWAAVAFALLVALFVMVEPEQILSAREKVLEALNGEREQGALAIAAETGLLIGTVYAVLFVLEERGLVTSRWEGLDYPRKRLYRRASKLG
jgi:DNA-binding transcriptional ArsR family regulator